VGLSGGGLAGASRWLREPSGVGACAPTRRWSTPAAPCWVQAAHAT
jgi:hypothetical protein